LSVSLARIISFIFHPLLMPTLLCGCLLYGTPEHIFIGGAYDNALSSPILGGFISAKGGLLLLVFLYTFVIPALGIYYMYRLGWVRSLQLQNLRDRRLPYLFTMLVYTFFTAYTTYFLPQLPALSLLIGGITLSICLVSLISLYWQISAHAVGVSGVLGAVGVLLAKHHSTSLFCAFLALLLLNGFVISARLRLNAHTPLQTSAGFILGFLVSVVCASML
jgi:membrane-associated phospholipid phosphatase